MQCTAAVLPTALHKAQHAPAQPELGEARVPHHKQLRVCIQLLAKVEAWLMNNGPPHLRGAHIALVSRKCRNAHSTTSTRVRARSTPKVRQHDKQRAAAATSRPPSHQMINKKCWSSMMPTVHCMMHGVHESQTGSTSKTFNKNCERSPLYLQQAKTFDALGDGGEYQF